MSLSIENVQVEGAFQKLPEPVKPTVIQNIQTKTKPISSKNQIFDNKLIINSNVKYIVLTFNRLPHYKTKEIFHVQ